MKDKSVVGLGYSNWQICSLTLLRVLIGWHFLYEGLVKLYDPDWSAKNYLLGSMGPLAHFFKGVAQSQSMLHIVDCLNEWGLILIGLSLFIGFLSKPSKIFGIILLLFYYLSYPPFANLTTSNYIEGSYWIVNRNLIEMGALFVLFMFPTSSITGIDRFIFKKKKVNIRS